MADGGLMESDRCDTCGATIIRVPGTGWRHNEVEVLPTPHRPNLTGKGEAAEWNRKKGVSL